MEPLRVSLVQCQIFWEDKGRNFQHLASLLEGLEGRTDLVLLPEMFTTGFSMAARRLAEPMTGPTVQWMRRQAQRLDAVVCGSFIAGEGPDRFNRLVWMRPDGSWEHYDKRHLFTLAGEQNHYTAGEHRLIVEHRGWKVLPLICYDLRFPVWSRNVEPYDLLLYVANFPARRRQAWTSLLRARAIENQAYTIGLNRVGHDGNEIYYAGDSLCFDTAGEPLLHLAHQEMVATVSLDPEKQRAFREKYAFLADRDAFTLR